MNKSDDSASERTGELGGTSERLLDAAMHLFARRGVAATTVGDIEAAAGLAPRSGALYKYFDSKDALLAAGLERHLATVADIEAELALRPLGDMRSEFLLLGRWLLIELEVERDITHVLEREGDHLGELRDRMREGISDRGYLIGADVLQRWQPDLAEKQRRHLSVIFVGALVNWKRSSWTFGVGPLAIDEDELLETWADLSVATVEGSGAGVGE